MAKNTYLSINFAPVWSEDDYTDLPVKGMLPPELDGRVLVRVGPNPQFMPINPALYLWFDGDGMMNQLYFRAGRVGFRNRYVNTRRYELEHSAGRALFGGIQSMVQATEDDAWPSLGLGAAEVEDLKGRVARGEGPTEDQYRKMSLALGVANTEYLPRDGRIVVLDEAGMPCSVDPGTLGTLGVESFGDRVKDTLCAHPIIDPRTGVTYAMGYWPFKPYLHYYVIDRDGRVKDIPIALPGAVMMHSFSVTERHVIFYDLPTTYDPRHIGTSTPLRWDLKRPARIGVMRRDADTDEVRWHAIPATWLFHVMNAFDQGDSVVMDVCQYPRVPMIDLPPDPPPINAQLTRWTLNLETGAFSQLAPYVSSSCEFPTQDNRYKTRPYTQGYLVATTVGPGFDTIVHCTFAAGAKCTTESWFAGIGQFVGEAVFTPRTPDAPEGDGFLLTLVWDLVANKSSLVILDAMNVAGGPIATVSLPRRVPFDFHGVVLTAPDRRVPLVPPTRPRSVAIIGSGASGLAAAWALHRSGFAVTVYEAAGTVGGNAHTVDFPTRLGYRVPVDMGVILTSPWAYPNLYALFELLGVSTAPMGVDVGGSFGPDDNWVTGKLTDGALWRRVAPEAARFDQQMAAVSKLGPLVQLQPLSAFLAGYSNDFVSKILCPILSVLVVSRSSLLSLPIGIVADLVQTQGFFAAATWRLIEGGTRAYYSRLAAIFADRIRLDTPVASVTRWNGGVTVVDAAGKSESYDQVVFATTADVALSLLGDPSALERMLLGSVQYDPAVVYLHGDPSVLSPYLPPETLTQYVYFGGDAQPTLQGRMTYNMAAALGIPGPLVTVYSANSTLPPPGRVAQVQHWKHPITTPLSMAAKFFYNLIQGKSRTWFCGNYTTLPTHEDTFISGLVVANQIGADYPFEANAAAKKAFDEMQTMMFPELYVPEIAELLGSLSAPAAAAALATDPVGLLGSALRDPVSPVRIRMYHRP